MISYTQNWAYFQLPLELKQGPTNIEMYRRAKAMAEGMADPIPTSYGDAPHSISIA